MVNEYGVKIDANHYAPSVVEDQDRCFVCGRRSGKLDRHEVFHGPFRDKSKRLGCWVLLCDVCHGELHHKGGGLDREVKERVQRIAMEHYQWTVDDFRERFGKSYI